MKFKPLLFILLCSYSFSQENILNLNKAEESKFVLDGILSEQELENFKALQEKITEKDLKKSGRKLKKFKP